MIPGLQERLMDASAAEIVHIGELVSCLTYSQLVRPHLRQIQKGSTNAGSDDMKSLKSVILDWITPRGQPLNPPLARNIKTDRRFHHERTGALLCPAGLNWYSTEYRFSTS
jgi:hypothetical protein